MVDIKKEWGKHKATKKVPIDKTQKQELNKVSEAIYLKDKSILQTGKNLQLTKREAMGIGVNPDNFDKIHLEISGLDYFRKLAGRYDTFAEVKSNVNLELTKEILKLKEVDLKEVWKKDLKEGEKVQKDIDKEYKRNNPDADIFTRRGQAQNFLTKQPLFYDESKLWWSWKANSSACWKMIDEVQVMNDVFDIINVQGISSKERGEVLNALKQEGRKLSPIESPKTWIQFKNGVIDLDKDTMSLSEVDKNYFVTNPLAWNLGESEDTPNMDRIFTEWVGEENKVQLYEILAYCMLPDYPIHRMFILLGGGLNGKSKFLQLMRKFIGEDNCSSTELDKLTGGNSRFEFTRFHKKLVCTMGETDFNEIQRTSVLKSLTGQDNIAIEYKGKDHLDYTNYAKIIIATNNLPSTNDKTVGFYRRPIIIDFPNQFTEKKDILSEIPDQEYENLGRKCINILKKLLTDRVFTNEGTIEDRMKRYEDRSNPFDKFWSENVKENFDEYITLNQFKKKFYEWCNYNKFRKMNDHEIGEKMKQKDVEKKIKNIEWYDDQIKKRVTTKVWSGIGWKE